jgi:hypothetical protein
MILVMLEKPCGIFKLAHMLVNISHLIVLNKPCGSSKLANTLIKINQINHFRQTIWHFWIGTHFSQNSSS